MQKYTGTTQGSGNRAGEVVDKEFNSIFEKEVLTKRQLPALEKSSKEDLVLNDKPEFLVSLLKNFLPNQEVKVADDEEEIIGDETDILKVKKINDEGKDKVLFHLFRSLSSTVTVTKSKRTFLKKICPSR